MMNTRDEPRDSECKLKTRAQQLYIYVIGVTLILIGIILLCTMTHSVSSEFVEDYTDCTNYHQPTIRCMDTLVNNKECICFLKINITHPMMPSVSIFYELQSYDQSNTNYSNSRDTKQLKGELSLTPSQDCEPFRYNDETKQPIAPCGAVADSMFNDTYSLIWNESYVPPIHTGLISEDDKAPYKNPPGNLEQAFNNFSKPKNWVQNVWELDKMNPDNNGFQNERFIGWMKTDLKRKPAWRVNHTGDFEDGIPAGIYTLRIEYSAPHTVFGGRRYVIISSRRSEVNVVQVCCGSILIILGLIFIITKVLHNKVRYGQYIEPTGGQ